ncbi:hypothetical protein OG884_14615 [Streptosporangium sp. NBC_01755]|uniref:hypothetical protein n=1 Tax=unclassified Streptosporangium TaxID=2632669 RepID=UPI002DD99361|nr:MULTISPECIES: hypothetical protein [unclassified Streptosporangium]WSA25538.1 hypothetical protein OIE13_32260 [Streptosporangium sp. NBC_01810]WSD03074.1 hypothetical protein OG884_14615 [Streptosporangium sp. NBC_01755]
MPGTELTLSETAVLVVLMVEVDEISNPELKARHGLTLDGKSRLKLNELKLVESRKVGRAFVHLLTEDGWARMAEEIQSGIPVPSGAAGAMNRALLFWLRGFLMQTGQSLADIFSLKSDPVEAGDVTARIPVEAGDVTARIPVEAGDVTARIPVEAGDVTARIRAAYAELAAEPGALVSLARLRPLLGEFARAEVDGALKGMIHLPGVSIVPANNQKLLSAEARAAAVTIGDQDKHLISIEVP